MSGLMGDWTCRPVKESGIHVIYQRGDVDALKERHVRLRREFREVVHENALLNAENYALRRENALLNEELSKYRRKAAYGDDLEWTNGV